jgi:hypothetical protein
MHWYEREGLNVEALISSIRNAELLQARDIITGKMVGRKLAQEIVNPLNGIYVALLAGEPMVGKSTLTWQLVNIARNAGREVNVISYSWIYRKKYDALPEGVKEISDQQRNEVEDEMFFQIDPTKFNIVDTPVHGNNVPRGGKIIKLLSDNPGLAVLDIVRDPNLLKPAQMTRAISLECVDGYQFEQVMFDNGMPVILPNHVLNKDGWEKHAIPFFRRTATIDMAKAFDKEIEEGVFEVEKDDEGRNLIRNYSEDVYFDPDLIGSMTGTEQVMARKIIGYKRLNMDQLGIRRDRYSMIVNKLVEGPRVIEIPHYVG